MYSRPGRIEEFLAKHGEKAYLVLKAIILAAESNWITPGLGDFSYRMVKEKLEEMGVLYNPSLLLRKLEKEYYLIETSYRSSGQHWWKILDREEIERGIRLYEGDTKKEEEEEEDYRMRLLKIQFYALTPQKLLEDLTRLSRKKKLSDYDRKLLRRIVFEELPQLVDILEKARDEYPEDLSIEISMAETIIDLVEKIVARGTGRNQGISNKMRLSQMSPINRSREIL